MEDKSESECEDTDSSRRLDACVVSSCGLDSVHSNVRIISGAASSSHGVGKNQNTVNVAVQSVEPSDITLREWLDKPERSVDLGECLLIFRQVVEIVNLAHSNGIVVHNVRPSCLSMSALRHISLAKPISCLSQGLGICGDASSNKIADGQCSFGLLPRFQKESSKLVCAGDVSHFDFLQSNSNDAMHQPTIAEMGHMKFQDGIMSDKSKEMDSHSRVKQMLLEELSWYSSPEEVAGAQSSLSSDIYRLGVLLFELVCTFSSTEEKLNTMSNLRHRVLPPRLLLKLPKEASFCLWLLHPQSRTRPKMSDLLQSEFLNEPREEREAAIELRNNMEEQELLLEFLLQMQQQKKESVNKLNEIIGCLSSDIEEILEKQPNLVTEGGADAEPSTSCYRTIKNIHDGVQCPVKNEHLASSGSRKRFKLGFQHKIEDGFDIRSDDIQNSYRLTENHQSRLSKSAYLMKNFKVLEKVYCSTRFRLGKSIEKLPSIDISSNKRGSTSINCLTTGNNQDRKSRSVNPFLDGLNSYLTFSKLKVRVELNQGEISYSPNLVCSLSFDRDNEFFATAGVSRKIKVFEYHMILNEGRSIHYPMMEMATKSKISSTCWNSYIKNQIASCDFEGVVQIWDVTRGKVLMELMEHDRRAWSVDFSSADPMMLASGSDDGAVKLWNINQGGSVGTIRSKANVCCVQFPPHSARSLVFGSADHKIYCYDLRNTKLPWCTFVGHAKTVSYVKFLDSTTLVSASTDNSIKLWDLSACTSQILDSPLQTFTGHSNQKNFVGLSVSDSYIATGSETNEVFIYHKAFPMPMLSAKFSDKSSLSTEENDPSQFVSSVCWHGQSSVLVAANSTGNIKLLEMS